MKIGDTEIPTPAVVAVVVVLILLLMMGRKSAASSGGGVMTAVPVPVDPNQAAVAQADIAARTSAFNTLANVIGTETVNAQNVAGAEAVTAIQGATQVHLGEIQQQEMAGAVQAALASTQAQYAAAEQIASTQASGAVQAAAASKPSAWQSFVGGLGRGIADIGAFFAHL